MESSNDLPNVKKDIHLKFVEDKKLPPTKKIDSVVSLKISNWKHATF